MAFDPDAYLAKKAAPVAEPPAPKEQSGFDPTAYLAKRGAAAPAPTNARGAPEGAPAGRFPKAKQRQKMDRMGSATDRVGDLAGGLNTALFDVVDLPSTAYNLTMDAFNAPGAKVSPTMSALRPLVADRTETMKNADSGMADFMRTATEWGGGAASVAAKFADKGSDLAMALGAASGEAVGGDVGELVGAVTGAFTPAGLKKMFSGGEGDVDKLMDGAQFLRNNMSDADYARLIQGIENGDAGSLQDLAQNYKDLPEIENTIRRMSPENVDAFDAAYKAREGQISDRFENTLTPQGSDNVDARKAAISRLQQTDRQVDANQAAGMDRAQQGRQRTVNDAIAANRVSEQKLIDAQAVDAQGDQAFGGFRRPDETSADLADEYSGLDEDLREGLVRPAWNRFEDVKEVETDVLKAELSKFGQSMPDTVRADLNSQYKGIMNKLENLQGKADPRDIQYVLSSIKQVTRNARATDNFGPIEKQLGEVRDIVDEALQNNTQVGPAFRNAIDATVEQKIRMGGKKNSRALALADDEPETFVSKLGGFKGREGAATVRRIVEDSGDPNVMAAGEEALRSELRRTKMDANVRTQYEAALDAFPDVKRDVDTAISNRTSLDEATKNAENTRAGIPKAEKEADTALTQAINRLKTRGSARKNKVKGLDMAKFAAKPNAYIDGTLGMKDYDGQLGKIYQRVKAQGDQAGEAFKSKVIGRLKNRIMQEDLLEKGTGENMKLGDTIQRLMDDGIVTDANRDEIVDIIAMQEGRRLRRSAGGSSKAIAGQSQGQQMMDDVLTTASILPILSAMPSSHQLMAAGMLKRTVGRAFKNRRLDPERMQKLQELMTDPRLFRQAIEGKITKDTSPAEMGRVWEKTFKDLGIFSGQANDTEADQ